MACEDSWTNDHTGGQDAVTQGKGVKGFHWCIEMSLGHSQRKPEVGLMAGNSLITLVRLIKRVGSSHHICRDIEGVGK